MVGEFDSKSTQEPTKKRERERERERERGTRDHARANLGRNYINKREREEEGKHKS